MFVGAVLSTPVVVCSSTASPQHMEWEEDHCYGCCRPQVTELFNCHHGDIEIFLVMVSGSTCFNHCIVILIWTLVERCGIHTDAHTETQNHTLMHTETQNHTLMHTQRHITTHWCTHRDTEPHTDAHTETETCTDAHTETHRHTHRHTHTHTHTQHAQILLIYC